MKKGSFRKIYMAVTADEYELPIAVGSASELSDFFNTSPKCIWQSIKTKAQKKYKENGQTKLAVVVKV